MCGKSPNLNDLIAAEIAATGSIPFARFMELALYHPTLGYYASERARIGRGGDFYTNVSVGPVFGRVMADQFVEMWRRLHKPAGFSIVQQGGNDGAFAKDVLDHLPPEVPVTYHIVEPLPALRDIQKNTLADHAKKVRWSASLDQLTPFVGVHFSNELVDALPFHLVRSTGADWEELHVVYENGQFAFHPNTPSPPLSEKIKDLPERPAGYVTELRPAADGWIKEVSAKLQHGYVLLADYGLSRAQLFAPHRTEGTFSCYRQHRRDADPLSDPGKKDITAHVDFTALTETATTAGLHFEGFTDQHHFLIGASQSLLRALEGPPDATKQKLLRGLQTLLHPETMGTQFHYLAFSREVPDGKPLTGSQFARGGSDALFDEV